MYRPACVCCPMDLPAVYWAPPPPFATPLPTMALCESAGLYGIHYQGTSTMDRERGGGGAMGLGWGMLFNFKVGIVSGMSLPSLPPL